VPITLQPNDTHILVKMGRSRKGTNNAADALEEARIAARAEILGQ